MLATKKPISSAPSANLPYIVALICVLLPFLSVHLTFAISVYFQNLSLCMPYWEQCHSISATGRQYPEFFFFKGLLIPTAVFMAAYWLLLNYWLKSISNGMIKPRSITIMGLFAAFALIVYTVTLGAEGEPYALARRIGVIFYFAFTAFAHLILLRHLEKLDTVSLCISLYQKRLTWICFILVSTAIVSALLGFFWDEGWDNWENAYEWWFSVFMVAMFYQVAKMWQATGFDVSLKLSKTAP
ncbi:hypothetical protein PN836_019795 [Ningiella sp. W23]|uniref:hypothetical protein n=1 Tax=Ningiella sp. W23 TaxID=3023715 RepID=UPI003756FAAD